MSTSMAGSRGPSGLSSKGSLTGGNLIPKGYERGQLSLYSPEQTQLFQQMFGHVGPDSYLSRLAGGDESMFNQLEAPALRQFQGLQGQIASRFGGGGGRAGMRTSGFQNEMTSAASNFAQELQARRMGLQQNALQELMGMSNQLLGQRPYEQFLTEKPQSFLKSLISGVSPSLSQAFGASFGGGIYG